MTRAGVTCPMCDASVPHTACPRVTKGAHPQTETEPRAADERIALDDFLARYRPGSSDDRTWDEEEAEILARVCLCCGQPGHYQLQLEVHLLATGADVVEGICVSPDGRSWDGHHRITAARRLGIKWVTFESPEENAERWVRDHGHVDWHGRTKGDCADEADLKRHWKVSHDD